MKNEKYSLMDDFANLVGASNKSTSKISLNESIEIAYKEILGEIIPKVKVTEIAQGLHNGPIPYNDEDLAYAVALNFFKNKDYIDSLKDQQLMARMRLLQSINAQKVNPLLARCFEDVLYKQYK